MVKYIRREREGAKLEFYYNEFVKRDWYKDKNLYDSTGRRIYFRVDGSKVYKNNSLYSDDPDQIRDMVEQKELDPRKKTVVLMVESMSTAMSLMPIGNFQPQIPCVKGAYLRPSLFQLKFIPPHFSSALSKRNRTIIKNNSTGQDY